MSDKKLSLEPADSNYNLRRMVIIILVLIITIGNLIIFNEQENVTRINSNIIQSYRTIRAINEAIISIGEANVKISDFLLNNNEEALNNLQQDIISAQVNLSTLDQLIQDDKGQVEYYNELIPLVTQKITTLQKIISAFNQGDKAAALAEANDKNRFELTRKINSIIIHIKIIEMNQLSDSQNDFEKQRLNFTYLTIAENLLCICLLILCFFTFKRNKFESIE
jgi:CHASE3 domain sensor protein